MRIPRGLLLIASLLLLFCVSNAVAQIIDDMENHGSDVGMNVVLEKRQDGGNSTATRDGDDDGTDAPSSTESEPPAPTSEPSTSSSTPRPPSTSSRPPSTTQAPTTASSTSSQRTTSPTTRRSTTPSLTTSPSVSITVITVRAGTSESLSTSSTIIPVVATDTTVNTSPDDNGDSGSSGLTKTQKNIVIGVVVGVGGAIILGGLAIVLWRARRKGDSNIDQDDLMRNNGSPLSSSGREMNSPSADASPFQATLDQYHKAPGPVNAASNF